MKPYYDHAGITIYHGDCRELITWLPASDLCLTDPPYGILADTGSAATRRSGGYIDNGKVQWDIAPKGLVLHYLRQTTNQQMIWGGCHLDLPPTLGYLVWDKQIDGLNFGECEFCWTSMQFAPRIFRHRAVMVDGGKQHPTQKPIALMKWCLSFAPDAKTVIDPFMGSGSVLVAAKHRGLTAVGIDMEERYCEIAARRLSQEVFDFG